ncbi:MAG: metalloregulator ArsR/SmtB family transcription factor [Bacteroidota bacterium]
MRDLLKILKALSDSQRLRIVKMLSIRPLCVCEITEVLELAQSTVSKHLSILRDADLILDEKHGKWVNYSLNSSSGSERMKELLDMVSGWLPDDETIRRDAKRVKTVDRELICKA